MTVNFFPTPPPKIDATPFFKKEMGMYHFLQLNPSPPHFNIVPPTLMQYTLLQNTLRTIPTHINNNHMLEGHFPTSYQTGNPIFPSFDPRPPDKSDGFKGVYFMAT